MHELLGGGAGTLFGGAAIMGILVGFWKYIKVYLSKIYSIFIVRVQVRPGQSRKAVAMYLSKFFKCSPFGSKIYSGNNKYVRPVKQNQLVVFEWIPVEPTIWWKGKRPLIVSGGDILILTFIRWTFNRDKLLQDAADYFNKDKNCKNWKTGDRFFVRKKHGSIGKSNRDPKQSQGKETEAASVSDDSSVNNKYISRPLKWKREELGQPNDKKSITNLSLSGQVDRALKEAILWRDSEIWFKERCIPWKRGWLFHGPPGTGKTAFTRGLGQELNMPIFSFDLATMNNKDFSDSWEDIMAWTPCIALFEDIDAIFEKRKNIAVKGMENGLTFDSFLNCIDGVENTDGMFIIITTNKLETIDPSIGNVLNGSGISTRPGRIDRLIEFCALDENGRIKMANRIMNGFDKSKWGFLLEEGIKDTGAQFQERCCRLALRMFWEERKTK